MIVLNVPLACFEFSASVLGASEVLEPSIRLGIKILRQVHRVVT